jgi:hypothetical protein
MLTIHRKTMTMSLGPAAIRSAIVLSESERVEGPKTSEELFVEEGAL